VVAGYGLGSVVHENAASGSGLAGVCITSMTGVAGVGISTGAGAAGAGPWNIITGRTALASARATTGAGCSGALSGTAAGCGATVTATLTAIDDAGGVATEKASATEKIATMINSAPSG